MASLLGKMFVGAAQGYAQHKYQMGTQEWLMQKKAEYDAMLQDKRLAAEKELLGMRFEGEQALLATRFADEEKLIGVRAGAEERFSNAVREAQIAAVKKYLPEDQWDRAIQGILSPSSVEQTYSSSGDWMGKYGEELVNESRRDLIGSLASYGEKYGRDVSSLNGLVDPKTLRGKSDKDLKILAEQIELQTRTDAEREGSEPGKVNNERVAEIQVALETLRKTANMMQGTSASKDRWLEFKQYLPQVGAALNAILVGFGDLGGDQTTAPPVVTQRTPTELAPGVTPGAAPGGDGPGALFTDEKGGEVYSSIQGITQPPLNK